MSVKHKVNVNEVPSEITTFPETGTVRVDSRWLITKQVGSRLAAFGRAVIKPSPPGIIPKRRLHKHPASEEIMYIISGTGKGFCGGEEVALGPGDAFFAPVGEPHMIQNTSETEDIVLVFCYGGACDSQSAGYEVVDS